MHLIDCSTLDDQDFQRIKELVYKFKAVPMREYHCHGCGTHFIATISHDEIFTWTRVTGEQMAQCPCCGQPASYRTCWYVAIPKDHVPPFIEEGAGI